MQYFQEWRAADRAAFAAERLVVAGTMRLLSGGSGPTENEIAEARRLRAIADARFKDAMQEMNEIGRSLKCRGRHHRDEF